MKKSKEQILSEQHRKHKARGVGQFIFFLFLVALSGFLFYLGWIQLKIPGNTRAVLFSRTNGFEETVFRPGQFLWRWQNCLPGNMTILLFPDEGREISVSGDGILPSGEIYGAWMGNPSLFKYKYTLKVRVNIDDKGLLNAVINESLTPETFDSHLMDCKDTITLQMSETLSALYLNQGVKSFTEKEILNALSLQMPGTIFEKVILESLDMPDPLLYQKARDGYLAEAASRQAAGMESVSRRASLEKDYESRLFILEKYGELLTRYPVLIDFFRVTADQDLKAVP